MQNKQNMQITQNMQNMQHIPPLFFLSKDQKSKISESESSINSRTCLGHLVLFFLAGYYVQGHDLNVFHTFSDTIFTPKEWSLSVSKSVQKCSNCLKASKLSKWVNKCPKASKSDQKCLNCPKLFIRVQNCQSIQKQPNCSKVFISVQTVQKRPNCPKVSKYPKAPKSVQSV